MHHIKPGSLSEDSALAKCDATSYMAQYAHVEDDHFVTAPADALGDGYAVLLGQHGPIVVGETLEDTLERTVTLEEAAKTYSISKIIGTPVPFTEDQAIRSYDYYTNRYGPK